jgi:CDP-paratose 2-epimerase
VYGDLSDVGIVLNGTRYHPENLYFRENGISESRTLDFHSPYGCSKGVADQYVLDYSRTFGLKTVVFRMSCIYGPHQYGTEDQGWVAHFLIQALKNQTITLYGDGKQVRDILYIDDLVNAFLIAQQNIDKISGNAFNIGGGVDNTVSLVEFIELIGKIGGKTPGVEFNNWRPGDQKYYVSDFNKFKDATGWAPETGTEEGLKKLHQWLKLNAITSENNSTKKYYKTGKAISTKLSTVVK